MTSLAKRLIADTDIFENYLNFTNIYVKTFEEFTPI